MFEVKSLANRLLGLCLCAVISVGLLPMFASTAHAAEPIVLSGNSFTTNPGEGFSMNLYCVCDACPKNGGESVYVYPGTDQYGHSFSIDSFSYHMEKGQWTVSFQCSGSSCNAESLSWSRQVNTGFDCINGMDYWFLGRPTNGNFDWVGFDLYHPGYVSHQGNPTCITSDTCALCWTEFKDEDNHEKPNEFVYVQSEAYPDKHDKQYACCNQLLSVQDHTLQYSSDGSVVTETCSVGGCDHYATATIVAEQSYVYTGAPITPSVSYSLYWAGAKPSASYQNNLNVTDEDNPAIVSVDIGGNTLTRTFSIEKAQPAPVVYPCCAREVTYGESLEDAGLDFYQDQFGTFAWRNPDQIPEVDAEGYDLDFRPHDNLLENYDWASLDGVNSAGAEGVMQWVEGENVLRINTKVPVRKNENVWVVEPAIAGWAFGDEPKLSECESKFGDVAVHYAGTANDGSIWDSVLPPIKAGSYVATYAVEETKNYTGLKTEIPFEIAKADYDLSATEWDYNGPFVYDGREHKVQLAGLPEGVTVVEYSGNTAVDLGNYTAKATLAYDELNFNEPVVSDLEWSIVETLPDSEAEESKKDGKRPLASLKDQAKSNAVATGDDSPVTAALATTALGALVVLAMALRMRSRA